MRAAEDMRHAVSRPKSPVVVDVVVECAQPWTITRRPWPSSSADRLGGVFKAIRHDEMIRLLID